MSKRVDVEPFERRASTWDDSFLHRELFTHLHTAVVDHAARLPPPASILDVGCGTGQLLRRCRSRWPNARLVGVDPARGMIEAGHRAAPTLDLRLGGAEALPVDTGAFDLVVSTASLHHWEDQAKGLHEVARVLRPKGHFILLDLNVPAWLAALFRTRALSARARNRLLRDAGLGPVGAHGIFMSRLLLLTVAAKEHRQPGKG